LNAFILEKKDKINPEFFTYSNTLKGVLIFRINQLVKVEKRLLSVAQRCLPFLDSILDGNYDSENNNNNNNDNNNINNNNNNDKKAKKLDVSKSVNTKILAMKGTLKGKGKKNKALTEGEENGGEGPGVKEVLIFSIFPFFLFEFEIFL
jgi:hypothetical protein